MVFSMSIISTHACGDSLFHFASTLSLSLFLNPAISTTSSAISLPQSTSLHKTSRNFSFVHIQLCCHDIYSAYKFLFTFASE